MNSPAPYPTYRDRYLPAMTPHQIAELPDKAWAPVIVPTGAIEQHGPHMPVAVDALMGQVWVAHALNYLPADVSAYVAPALTIGKSNEHTGFPGTLIISKDTLRALLFAIARQIQAWGFRQMAVLNTHGGNSSVLVYTLREIHASLGLRATLLRPRFDLVISEQEAAYGFHAGEVETSWILSAAGKYVVQSLACREYPARLDDPGQLRPESAPATFAWASQDVSKSGVMGDATAATAEKGKLWLDHGAERYAGEITTLYRESRRLAEYAASTQPS